MRRIEIDGKAYYVGEPTLGGMAGIFEALSDTHYSVIGDVLALLVSAPSGIFAAATVERSALVMRCLSAAMPFVRATPRLASALIDACLRDETMRPVPLGFADQLPLSQGLYALSECVKPDVWEPVIVELKKALGPVLGSLATLAKEATPPGTSGPDAPATGSDEPHAN